MGLDISWNDSKTIPEAVIRSFLEKMQVILILGYITTKTLISHPNPSNLQNILLLP